MMAEAPIRWADRAMYPSEEMQSSRPVVKLVSMNSDPLGDLASMWGQYAGKEYPFLDEITDEQRLEAFQEVMKTRLKAPLESIKMHFLISGVTRAFTHQIVRQRTAVYAQESLRFAVIEDGFANRVQIPPSILRLPVSDERYQAWLKALDAVEEAYRYLVANGIPAEDARGLLPTNITTRLHYITDLRNLLEVMGNRLCTQAQFEWRAVAVGIAQAISNAETEDYTLANGRQKVYMAGELATIFRPVCYLTGKCEFMANLDRHCGIRDRVQANHKIGRPSSEWDEPMEPFQIQGLGVGIPAIHPNEWLTDPYAAVAPPTTRS
jgi:flavin-dependent thymidylate synthase